MSQLTPNRTIVLFVALALAGCRDGAGDGVDAGPSICTATFSGALADRSSIDGGCSGLFLPTDGGSDLTLQIQVGIPSAQSTLVFLADLGATPSIGTFSPATVQSWSAIAGDGDAGCELSAGDESVPQGSFSLTLTTLDAATAPSGIAHGTLHIDEAVQASPGTECGTSNTEQVDVTF